MSAPPNRKVLLIDDSEISLELAAALLKDEGYEVRTVNNVEDFDAAVEDWAPDIILTDVNMPGITGAELCRLLKASYQTAHVPVVLYSSLSNDELEVLAQECSADGFVSKAEGYERLPAELELLGKSLLW